MVTTSLVLDNRRKTVKGIYQIKIRITFNRKQKYYQTNYFATEDEYAELQKVSLTKKNKAIKTQLEYLELKAKTIVQSLTYFSFEAFKQAFYNTSYNRIKTLESLYQDIVKKKMDDGDISTAVSYRSCFRILKLFKEDVSFFDITPDFLRSLQRHLLSENKSITTVGFYFRTLKSIMNIAIKEKLIPPEMYPFGKGKYIIPSSTNPKRALTKTEIQAFFEYLPAEEYSMEDRAKDFWILSYLCNGMNLKDILLLKKKDIRGQFLYFVREKTKNTSTNSSYVDVPLLDDAKRIIKKWGCTEENNIFLFPFIKADMSAVQVYKTIQQFIKMTNKYNTISGHSLGLSCKLTTYWARHSFSKAMSDSGQPIMYISKCLNHKKITTTQSYLNSFEDYNKHQIANDALINFITV